MSSEYKIQKQEQQETAIVPVMCDPYKCGRGCGNRLFMASYNELGIPTPGVSCIPTET